MRIAVAANGRNARRTRGLLDVTMRRNASVRVGGIDSITMLAPLLELAQDLSADLAASERHRRCVEVARRIIPCDAIALMRLDGDVLTPVVVDGLRGEAAARRFAVADHPRLARIIAAKKPVQACVTCRV